jgi:hypothetical protein
MLSLVPAALAAQEQVKASGKLMLTTSSEEARTAFWAGLDDMDNVYFERGATHLQHALELDPKFGLARVIYGAFAPALTADQRKQEIDRGTADAASASTGELLVAMAWRANAPERAQEQKVLFDAAAVLLPAEPHVAYYQANALTEPRARTQAFEQVTSKFPDFAPPHNLLAYARFSDNGDRAGGIAAAEQYAKLAPNHPNSHDTYAELLAWAGRLDEAELHYQKALSLDANYVEAHNGLAEVAMLKGDGAAARTHYAAAIAATAAPQTRLNYRQALAVSFVNDGNIKAAITELGAIAAEAEQAKFNGLAAAAYRNMAVIEAALGNQENVDGHLAKAAGLVSAENVAQLATGATAHALLGHAAAARPLVDRLCELVTPAESTPGAIRNSYAALAVVTAAEKNAEGALAHAKQAASAGALGKVMAAEILKKSGSKAEAQTLKAEVLAQNETDLLTVIAKQRVKKI